MYNCIIIELYNYIYIILLIDVYGCYVRHIHGNFKPAHLQPGDLTSCDYDVLCCGRNYVSHEHHRKIAVNNTALDLTPIFNSNIDCHRNKSKGSTINQTARLYLILVCLLGFDWSIICHRACTSAHCFPESAAGAAAPVQGLSGPAAVPLPYFMQGPASSVGRA